MKIGTLFTGAAGALTYYLKEHAKQAEVPDYAWYIVLAMGVTGVFFSAIMVPFIQSFYLENYDAVSKKQ